MFWVTILYTYHGIAILSYRRSHGVEAQCCYRMNHKTPLLSDRKYMIWLSRTSGPRSDPQGEFFFFLNMLRMKESWKKLDPDSDVQTKSGSWSEHFGKNQPELPKTYFRIRPKISGFGYVRNMYSHGGLASHITKTRAYLRKQI